MNFVGALLKCHCLFPHKLFLAGTRLYNNVDEKSLPSLNLNARANGLAFSCRERAAHAHIKSERSRARSGLLQCRVSWRCFKREHEHYLVNHTLLGRQEGGTHARSSLDSHIRSVLHGESHGAEE